MTAKAFWQARGAVYRSAGAAARASHFGDPAAEARTAAIGQATCLAPLLDVTALRLTGTDRAAFLHGQLSNEVEGLREGECNHTLQLNARGQMVGEATLCVRESDIVLVVEDGKGPAVRASLEDHIVFDDVSLEDLTGTLAAFTIQGPGAERMAAHAFGKVPDVGRFTLAALGTATGDEGGARALLVRRRRSKAGGVDVHLPIDLLPEALAAFREAGAQLVGQEALALMRVLAGVPAAARDGAGGGLPQELGLVTAVSYRKGCYLGQEIMARIEARGAVHKGLARLRLTPADATLAPAELEGRAVRSAGREAGRLGTVASLPEGGLAALSVLRLDLPEGAPLAVEDVAGREVATAERWPLPVVGDERQGGRGGSAGEGGVQPERPLDPEL